MKERIIKALQTYFSMLNMDPRRVETVEKAPDPDKPVRMTPLWVHLLLFLLTLITTTFAYPFFGEPIWSVFQMIYASPEPAVILLGILSTGLPYSLTLLAILTCHEMGHYIATRRFGLKASLPYFIPFPMLIGTMGAVIKMKSPLRSTRALLYIGAAGPLAGFVVSLAAVIGGILISDIRPLPLSTPDSPTIIFGDSLLFAGITKLVHGTIPPGHDIFLSPYAWAGWIGFLITSLNLMPLGQLDGGHILHALVGRKQLYAGWFTLVLLVVLTYFWPGWFIWIVMTLAFLMVAHPPHTDSTSLSFRERIIGWTCMLILVLTFVPAPVDFPEDKNLHPLVCPDCRNKLEPSGLLYYKDRVLIVSDNDDPVIYQLLQTKEGFLARPYISFNEADLQRLTKKHKLDLEGLAEYKGNFYAVDERDRLILEISPAGNLRSVPHDIDSYARIRRLKVFSRPNASLEGIAADPSRDIFYVACEREDAVLFLLKREKNGFRTIGHTVLRELTGRHDTDISDLCYDKGHLYVLFRKGKKIIKMDAAGKKILEVFDFSKITQNLYPSEEPYGLAEGLFLSREFIILTLDSNGEAYRDGKGGQHGTLVVLTRPRGF